MIDQVELEKRENRGTDYQIIKFAGGFKVRLGPLVEWNLGTTMHPQSSRYNIISHVHSFSLHCFYLTLIES